MSKQLTVARILMLMLEPQFSVHGCTVTRYVCHPLTAAKVKPQSSEQSKKTGFTFSLFVCLYHTCSLWDLSFQTRD